MKCDPLDSAGSRSALLLAASHGVGRGAGAVRRAALIQPDGCDAFAWPVSNERAWFDHKDPSAQRFRGPSFPRSTALSY